MATVHPAVRDELCTSLCLANKATTSQVVPATATKTEEIWLIWLANCTELDIIHIQDPSTSHTSDYLAAFALKVNKGEITPDKRI